MEPPSDADARRAVPAVASARRACTRCARSCRDRTSISSTCSAPAHAARGDRSPGARHRLGSRRRRGVRRARRAGDRRRRRVCGRRRSSATSRSILRLARAMDMQRRVGVAPATLYAWANADARRRRRRHDRPGGQGALRRDALARGRAHAQRSAARRAPRRARRLPAAADARSRRHEPQPAVRVLPHRRRHEPVHAHVADPAGDRRGADVLPALPDEPRAEGAAARSSTTTTGSG